MKFILFISLAILPVLAFAQSSPPPSASPALVGQAAISTVNNATSKVPASVPTGLIVALSFVITELAARGIPTTKPQSWFLFAEALIGAVVAFLQKVQGLLVNIGTAFNNTSSPS